MFIVATGSSGYGGQKSHCTFCKAGGPEALVSEGRRWTSLCHSVQTLGGVDASHLHWGGPASVFSLPIPVLVSPETPHKHPQKCCFTSSPGIPEPRHHRVFICGVELLDYR